VYWVEVVSDKLPEEIPVVALDFDRVGAEKMIREFRTLGAILGEQGKANEAVNWIKKYEGIVEDRVEGLAPEEIITYYIETYGDFVTYGSNAYEGIAAAGCGGRNLVDGAGFPAGGYGEFKVSPEWVLEQDPDVIFCRLGGGGFEWTNEDSETRLNELLARPGWEELSAVKEGRVYLYDAGLGFSPRYIVLRACFAKWLHPDLFKDLDPDSIHKEYWKELLGIDIDLEGGVWAYPPLK
jgi:iron complex transport system substrate-binding protein